MLNAECSHRGISRRDFLAKTAAVSALTALGAAPRLAPAGDLQRCSIVVFSKIYQELSLGFEPCAALTREAGLDGVDCPVRTGGEIEPASALQKLPEYAEILRKQELGIHLITSGINGADSPFAEPVLRTAQKLGVKFYRLGYFSAPATGASRKQIAEVRSRLKDLAALNREIGVCGLFQNHSGVFGSNLTDLRSATEGLDPDQIGIAFDIGHALITHGANWRAHFEDLRPQLRVVYIKDVNSQGQWVRFGEGQIAGSGYFSRLKELNYSAPVSLHIEFDWPKVGTGRDRETLLTALRESAKTLRRWLREA